MFAQVTAAFVIASLSISQTPIPAPQIAPPPAAPNAPAPSTQTIVVPTGTTVPLTLMSVVKSKSTKPGDTVRAVVAFPVTIGTQLAIPAGTFVEGEVTQVTAHPKGGRQPSFRVHFTRLLFSNGYSSPLNGENTQALALPPDSGAPANEVAELTPTRLPGARFAIGEGQQTPTLPRVGPNPAVIGGAVGGAFIAIVVGMIFWAHHSGNNIDFALYDAGWQFQMVLDSPVTLDAAQVAAAAVAPSSN
ncbi:MAG: hypothetical protein ABSF23_09955 [Terracidiphilus sp.]|jgi:type IV secretion system protein VirB10